MDKKNVQVVLVIVCLAAAALILAYSMGLFGGSSKGKPSGTGSGTPHMAPVQAPAGQ